MGGVRKLAIPDFDVLDVATGPQAPRRLTDAVVDNTKCACSRKGGKVMHCVQKGVMYCASEDIKGLTMKEH